MLIDVSLARAFVDHMDLSFIALAIALLIAGPIGVLVSRQKRLASIVITGFSIVYTVPSLAMLAFMVPVFGLGRTSAIFALVIYAQFILIRHIVLGMQQIDPMVLESARGMGMTAVQRFIRVEIPLALPVWLSGLRIATLSTIGIATTAAWINAGGLGTLIFEGMSQNNPGKIMTGAILIGSLSLIFDQILGGFESAARLRSVGANP